MKLFGREKRSGGILNNPAIPLSMAGFLTWAFGGAPTAAGESVTPESALQEATVYACVRVLAEAVASNLTRVFLEEDGERKELPKHWLAQLLRAPNADMTAFSFWECLTGCLNLRGNCYAQIQRSAAGRPTGLWPLHPAKTKTDYDEQGNLYYTTTDGEKDGRQRTIAAEDMFHVPLFSLDGVHGLSPIQLQRQNIGLSQAAVKYGARWFGGGGKPPGILINKSPNISPEQQALIRKSWNETQAGENQGKTAVLTGDWSYQAIGIAPEDSQFLATRQFERTVICGWYKVAPHMVGDTTKMSNNNAEQMSLSFVIDTLRPLAMRFEQEIQRKLAPDNSDLVVEFDMSGRMRGDFKSTMDGMAVGKQWGIFSTNDCRRKLNMNAVGGVGDVLWAPVNMQNSERMLDTESIQDQPIGAQETAPGKSKDAPAAATDGEDDPDAGGGMPGAKKKQKKSVLRSYELAFALVFRDAMGRMVRREKRDAEAVSAIFGPVLASVARYAIGSRELDVGPLVEAAERSLTARAHKFSDADADGRVEFHRMVRLIHIGAEREAAAQAADKETEDASKND